MSNIDKLCRSYIAWSILLTVVLVMLGILAGKCGVMTGLAAPMTVGAVFSIVVEMADALVWRRVARKSPDSLTTFYSAVSGFRMLLALVTMLVCYVVVGRDAVMPYIVVMLVLYFVMLAHHSTFFSRLANGGKLNSK